MAPSASISRARVSSLFRRIYGTLVLTVLGAALIAAMGTWTMAKRLDQRWVGDAIELLTERNNELSERLHQPRELHALTSELSNELRTRIVIYNIDGQRLAGEGPSQVPHRAKRQLQKLANGHPIIRQRNQGQTPTVLFPLRNDMNTTVAVVHVAPRTTRWRFPILLSGIATLAVLGLGAATLSRSLTRRIERLERSADRIARGELGHRVALDPAGPVDEVDELGIAFNEMADKVQTLVVGQQTLLANVSHELRTPIARVRVLLEILEERVDALEKFTQATGQRHVQRLRTGLHDITTDTREIEQLIHDLLTSGRLELRDDGAGLEIHPVDIHSLCQRMAHRVNAQVVGDDDEGLVIDADELLLERLLSNLLANARRACPNGAIEVHLSRDDTYIEIAVEDEGPGIAETDREQIFEPFRRLDAARSRDKGGVGLGLYLSRQIARAHGGDVVAEARSDGASGARMVVTLRRQPLSTPSPLASETL